MNILYCRTILSIYPKLKKRITTLENLAFKRAMAEFYSHGNLNKGGITAPFEEVIKLKNESGLLQYLYNTTTTVLRSAISQDEFDAIAYWFSPKRKLVYKSSALNPLPPLLSRYSQNSHSRVITRIEDKLSRALNVYLPDTDFKEFYLPIPIISLSYSTVLIKASKRHTPLPSFNPFISP